TFYREVFGWATDTVADSDEFRYSTATFEGEALVGVMDGGNIPRGLGVALVFLPRRRRRRQDRALVTDNGGGVLRGAGGHPVRQACRGHRPDRCRVQPVLAGG
ncbi:hypothetical protein H7I76_18655, partial [Mycolicibacterium vaccae]|nr:hypothetical protein [Mycolicibacterium vaccae]